MGAMRIVQPASTIMKVKVAGSNVFGRHPIISSEKTYNMFLSDGWIVPTPGYQKVLNIDPLQEGRGVFSSVRGKFIITVVGNGVYVIDKEIKKVGREIPISDTSEQISRRIGEIDTFSGDVFIDENDAEQIGICDKNHIYIYDYQANTFQKAVTDFRPGYIAFQDGYFIAPDSERPQWRLSALNDGLVWPAGASSVGELETKPDNAKACVRMPGKGNQLFVMGQTVTEPWDNVGYKLFPYNRTNSFNIDYGCANQATIATGDKFIIWLGENEKSGPSIMASTGGPAVQISNDGINYELSKLSNPEDAYGFIFKSDGHLFYQLTFKSDNITYLYDINDEKFYYLSDTKMDKHIAKKVTFFENDYYFISFIDGNLYRMSGDVDNYDGKEIPRIRITNTIRMGSNQPFIAKKFGMIIEQGESINKQVVDMSLSYDYGVSFGNSVRAALNPSGKRLSEFVKWDLGRTNGITMQFRFWGNSRFVCGDAYLEVYM